MDSISYVCYCSIKSIFFNQPVLSSVDIRGHFLPYVVGVPEEGHGFLEPYHSLRKVWLYSLLCLKHSMCINSDISVPVFLLWSTR